MRSTLAILLLALLTVFPAAAQQDTSETTRVGDGVYRFRYQNHNTFFVVTGDGVVAFDPISTTAAEVYARAIQEAAPGQPLRAIVYSHHHADHVSGAHVLQQAFGVEVPIIAHEAARPRLVEAGDPDLPPPTMTFSDQTTLHFGGRTLELHHLGRNHSDNSLVALLPDDRIAFAVDFVSHDRVGYRELPDYYFPDFFDSLRRLQKLPFDTIVFGHGAVGDKASIDRQIQYYDALRAAVEEAVRAGQTEDEAAAGIQLPEFSGWDAYDNWFALNVRAIYRWVASQE